MRRALPATAGLLILLGAGNVPADNTRVAQKWIAVWNSHDVDEVLRVFTEDVFYEDLAFGVVNRGHGELRAFATSIFAAVPDFRLELVTSSVNGRQGTIEWVLTGTDVGLHKTGRRFSVRGVTVLELDGHKISRNLDYYDLATVLRQLGLLPSGL